MKLSRRTTVLLMAALALIPMAACGTTDATVAPTSASRPTIVTPSPSVTGYKGAPDLQAPEAPKGKKWRKPGDLCKVITPEVAARALQYSGTFRAYEGASGIPVPQLLDACSYAGLTAPGMLIILTVRKSADMPVWDGFLQDARKNHPNVRIKSFTMKGDGAKDVRRAMATPRWQGLVWRRDGRLAVTRNPSQAKVKPDRLVELAQLALNVTN